MENLEFHKYLIITLYVTLDNAQMMNKIPESSTEQDKMLQTKKMDKALGFVQSPICWLTLGKSLNISGF